MVALATVLVAILVSLLIARVATVALTLTGLSRESARFQARSALSGTGFTTSEAESVVNHPARRQIVMTLMLLGSAGLVTVVATLMLSFTGTGGRETLIRLVVLVVGLTALVALAKSTWVDRRLSAVIAILLRRWTRLEARDYGALLHLAEHYAVVEIAVRDGDWLSGRTLAELDLRGEGVIILGITLPDGTWLGSPTFDIVVLAGDQLLAYGPEAMLADLDSRPAGTDGDAAHHHAAARHLGTVRDVTALHRPKRP